MNTRKYICFAVATLLLSSCGVKKAVAPAPVAQEPAWHTCLIQGARATITSDGESFASSVTMQTVRDSMLVISVTPMLGMEVIRFEATPFELTGINKLDGTYATTTYAELNRTLVPTVNWDVLQQTCTAELPTGAEKAHLLYSLGDKTIEIFINYPVRKLDVPVRVMHQRVDKYTKIDISRWL